MSRSFLSHPIYRKLIRRRRLLGVLITVLSWGTLYVGLSLNFQPDLSIPRGGVWTFSPWIGEDWILLILIFLGVGWSLLGRDHFENNPQAISIVPMQKEIPDWIVDPQALQQMIVDLAKEMGVNVSRAYVVDKVIPNAFATFVWQKGDMVVLNRNLIEIFDTESLRSVIAHELAHVAGDDVQHRVLSVIPRMIVHWLLIVVGLQLFAVLLLGVDGKELFARVMQLGIWALCVGGWFGFLQWWSNQYSQVKEKMADIQGAAYTSVEGSINGFLRLNARSHTLQAFQKVFEHRDVRVDRRTMIQALQLFPTGAVTVEKVFELAPRCYAEAKLKDMLQILSIEMSEEQQADWVASTLSALFSEVATPDIPEMKIPFAWQQFDWNHDGLLQTKEIEAMVEHLKANPKALTHDEGHGTHPSTRHRILLLADVFLDDVEV